MKKKIILVVYCVLCMNCCVSMPMSRQDFADFMQYIQRSSRQDRLTISQDGASVSESEEEGNAWENGDKFEGDMILNRRQRLQIIRDIKSNSATRNGHRNLSKRWPNNELIYSITKKHFSTSQIEAIEAAVEILGNLSCVKFRKSKKGDKHKVVVQGSSNRCYSHIGFQKGKQVLNLNPNHKVGDGCFRPGTIQHEFLHALGFFHMHSNPNRDEYVRVHWENIIPDKRKMFLKYRTEDVNDFGIPYEYKSIMHYSRKARSMNGKDTLEPLKDPIFNKSQREALTYRDIRKLQLMYCEKKNTS